MLFRSYAISSSYSYSGSFALTASYALNGGGGGATSVANQGVLIGTASYFDFIGNNTFTLHTRLGNFRNRVSNCDFHQIIQVRKV